MVLLAGESENGAMGGPNVVCLRNAYRLDSNETSENRETPDWAPPPPFDVGANLRVGVVDGFPQAAQRAGKDPTTARR